MEPARTAASTHTDSAERISAASAGTAGGTDGTDARPDQGRQLPPALFDETKKNGWKVLSMNNGWLRISSRSNVVRISVASAGIAGNLRQ